MRATVDEEGHIRPIGAAKLLYAKTEHEAGKKLLIRIFQCNLCLRHFQARSGETTLHDCPDQQSP